MSISRSQNIRSLERVGDYSASWWPQRFFRKLLLQFRKLLLQLVY